ncbi:hypothetical protein [Synechococcus sp. CBW1108]|uniref:hypothetical protein n=1 Tax=Synechococcus sp. CBW1108 TaxID=1353147 RepID=UPI0018CFD62C|nr:hypothetical protein [Synechococcus sp. CBW1108]QPN70080.1 hypothetical protein H8F27_16925 [Synechococcus sp. CBW1108]
MGWHPYNLDHLAQEIVLKARHRDPGSLNQSHKMRASCAYGLERFWGEHLRLKDKEPEKAAFVGDVWKALVGTLKQGGVTLPATLLSSSDAEATIQGVAAQIWSLKPQEQQVALAVLRALCDAVVWWTQRLKAGVTGDN